MHWSVRLSRLWTRAWMVFWFIENAGVVMDGAARFLVWSIECACDVHPAWFYLTYNIRSIYTAHYCCGKPAPMQRHLYFQLSCQTTTPHPAAPSPTSRPHQVIEQRPCKHEPRQPRHEAASPEREGRPEVPARVEEAEPRGSGVGRHTKGVKKEDGNGR